MLEGRPFVRAQSFQEGLSLRIGDYVRIGNEEGVVSDVGALSTKIVTVAREEITVPNAVLVGTSVTNFTKLAGGTGRSSSRTRGSVGATAARRRLHELRHLASLRARQGERAAGVGHYHKGIGAAPQ